MKSKIFLFLLLMFSVVSHINAAQGCCSYHGGIAYCGSSGYYICNDGTRSPSCTCSVIHSEEITDTPYYNSSTNNNNESENENTRIIEEKNKLQEQNTAYQWWIIILGFSTFILGMQRLDDYLSSKEQNNSNKNIY